MFKLSNTVILLFFSILLFLDSIKGISLQEAYFVHQKVKSELNQPRILSADFGPTYNGNSPVLHIDSRTGDIRVLRPHTKLTLAEILEKARRKLQQNKSINQSSESSSSNINQFNNLRPNLTI